MHGIDSDDISRNVMRRVSRSIDPEDIGPMTVVTEILIAALIVAATLIGLAVWL